MKLWRTNKYRLLTDKHQGALVISIEYMTRIMSKKELEKKFPIKFIRREIKIKPKTN